MVSWADPEGALAGGQDAVASMPLQRTCSVGDAIASSTTARAGGDQGGTAHHAVGQPVPAAGLGGRFDPADSSAEQHQQRRDDEQGAGGGDDRHDRAP